MLLSPLLSRRLATLPAINRIVMDAPLPPALPVAINKDDFETAVDVVALRLDAKKCGTVLPKARGFLWRARLMKSIVPDTEDSSKRVVLLDKDLVGGTDLSGIQDEAAKAALAGAVAEAGATASGHTVTLGYEQASFEQVLRKYLPEGVEPPAAYTATGHLAHFNLLENQMPYRRLIGSVLLDKVSGLRSVVVKTSTIKTEFRTFPLEVVAGDDDLNVEVRESGATFRFNFAEVYWNSRLSTEHARIVNDLKPGDVVCDMFCGIGPFAVPAGLRGFTVHANDLNPKSYEYLVANVERNKVSKHVTCYNMDARAFLKKLAEEGTLFSVALMNLPADGVSFLDCFVGSFDASVWTEMPTIHCYCFSMSKVEAEWTADVVQRVATVLGMEAPPPGISVRLVRDVAPNKSMLCATFKLPEAVAFRAADAVPAAAAGAGAAAAADGVAGNTEPPGAKRVRVE